MPEDFIWGPAGRPKMPCTHDLFAAGTPQVFYWAYISDFGWVFIIFWVKG